MGWQDELAAKVAATAEDDWDNDWYAVPGPVVSSTERIVLEFTETKEFELNIGVPHGTLPAWDFRGKVNDRPVAGVGTGCLFVASFRGSPGAPTVMAVRLRRRPWNHVRTRDGTFGEYRDADGKLPFEPADLSLIP